MIGERKVLAVTLARAGSKRIKGKNFALINGKPLIQYTIDEVRKSTYIDFYMVSTDSPEIKDFCQKQNICTIRRPPHLCTDEAKSSEALLHAVNTTGGDYYYVIEVMATNPCKTVEDIDNCIEMIYSKQVHSVVSVAKLGDYHPSRIKWLDKNNVMQDFYPEAPESRSQDLSPTAYIRNGSIYAMSRWFLLNSRQRYDKRSLAYVMPPERCVNIDEPIDLLVAREMLK